MNKNILIVFGGAVLVAILVAVLVQVSLGGKKEPAQMVQAVKTQILVAEKDLKLGDALKDADTRWQDWPEEQVFQGAIARKDAQAPQEALKGRLVRDVSKGEPLTQSALLDETDGNFVAASLEPGMRAMAVNVSASAMAGGFIGPGDFVDIILTYKENIDTQDDDPRVNAMLEMNLEKFATETILQNIKVLAVDQSAQRPEDNKIKVGKTVTLAVGAQEAERLSLARELGDLNLVLRGVGDEAIVEKKWPTISDARLTNMDDEIFTEYRKLKRGSGSNNDVKIYNGGHMAVMSTR